MRWWDDLFVFRFKVDSEGLTNHPSSLSGLYYFLLFVCFIHEGDRERQRDRHSLKGSTHCIPPHISQPGSQGHTLVPSVLREASGKIQGLTCGPVPLVLRHHWDPHDYYFLLNFFSFLRCLTRNYNHQIVTIKITNYLLNFKSLTSPKKSAG